jgi:vacuolar-type H+-ATPase subunit D/Vma8
MIGVALRTRAERQRLINRLALVERAADLLRSKEEALERERVRLGGHEVRTREEWTRQWSRSTTELLRAKALGAGVELDRIARGPIESPATFTPDWQRSMGIAYPGSVTCDPGAPPAVTSTAALRPATDAICEALTAGAQHAAAAGAVRRLDAELRVTRRRRRALEEHLQPTLEAARRSLDLHLDELDRDEALRVRLARDRKEAK